jgi:RNA polymerase sigma factor (sigma-70 family)
MKDSKKAQLVTKTLYANYQREVARLQAGGMENDIMLHVKAVGIIPQEDQRLLAIAAKSGNTRATELLTLTNYLAAKKLSTKYLGKGVEESDIIQTAMVGMLKGIPKFNSKQAEASFLTYLSYWMRQSVGRSVQKSGSSIKLPAYLHDIRIKIERALRECHAQSLEPSIDNIMAQLSGDETPPERKHVQIVMDYLAQGGASPVSLDTPLQGEDGDGSSLGERIHDHGLEVHDAMMSSHQYSLTKQIQEIVDNTITDPFQHTVVCRRFGLGGCTPTTAKRISEDLGEETPNRVNKALQSALKQLRPALEEAGVTPDL